MVDAFGGGAGSAIDEHFKMRTLKLVYPRYPPISQQLNCPKNPRSTPLYTILPVSMNGYGLLRLQNPMVVLLFSTRSISILSDNCCIGIEDEREWR